MNKEFIYTIDGVSGTFSMLCKFFKLSETCVRTRMARGMNLKEALTTPKMTGGRPKNEGLEPIEPFKAEEPKEPEKRKPVFVHVSSSGGYWK